jgi:N-acetyl-1-D-myo-inositol-2-amino-2-deoxy-alpha-D-glucopyranoside deacetylase
MAERLRVLGLFPHPDDESYSCGGTLARLVDEGAAVRVVCATAGEAGEDRRDGSHGAPNLGAVRAAELARSCAALGVAPPRMLGLPDGGIGTVDFPAVVGALVTELRAFRPHIVLTLGEDGVYGHPDHLALYRLTLAAYASAGGGERFPSSAHGPEWRPLRLFLAAFPRGMFRPMYEHMLRSEYDTSIRQVDPDSLGAEPAQVAAAIDIRAVAERKLAAIGSHFSQLVDGDPYSLFPGDLVRRTLAVELFTLGAGVPVKSRLRAMGEDLEL